MEEGVRQLALVSSVLGGFSFTFLSALLLSTSEKRIKFWLMLGFMIASMCFLLSALGWSMIDLGDSSPENRSHHQNLVKLLLLGLIAIIFSLGISGWMINRKTGIATAIISVLALLFLVFGILSRYIVM